MRCLLMTNDSLRTDESGNLAIDRQLAHLSLGATADAQCISRDLLVRTGL